jgi:hypothetical protein
MHVLINVKSPNNISKWQMGFNSAFKGLIISCAVHRKINLHLKWRQKWFFKTLTRITANTRYANQVIFCISAISVISRSQRSRGLGRRSMAARLLRLWVRIPPGAWMFVCCECCVLSGRNLCDELITSPEKSYRLWCFWVWSRNLVNEEALAPGGLSRQKQANKQNVINSAMRWPTNKYEQKS